MKELVTDFDYFKTKLANYEVENIDEECHQLMQTIKSKYQINTSIFASSYILINE